MPVGSHKDAFKAHQMVKKLVTKQTNPSLAQKAAEILLDFVKSSRQVSSENVIESLPDDISEYDAEKLDKALVAVDSLCGKCDESHDDACFVNQSRRILIAAKTGIDLGIGFDGKKTLSELLKEAEDLAEKTDAGEQKKETAAHHATPEGSEISTESHAAIIKKYEEMKEKDIFRSTLIDEIMETISKVAEGDFAAEMPVHDDMQLGKLASAFNMMLGTVNRTMENLDNLVAERSAEMRMVMNTVPVGLLSIDESYRVNPEYSKACEKILGMGELRGRNFFDLLGLTKKREKERKQLSEFLNVLKQQLLPEEDMAPLNPFQEFEFESATEASEPQEAILVGEDRRDKNREPQSKWLKINYHIINRGNEKPCHLLVVLEDISRAKAMAEEIKKSEKDNSQLRIIAENPDLFCEFLEEAIKMVKTAKDQTSKINSADDHRPLVNEIFRGVHTIKGTAASLDLNTISKLSAELENRLSDLRTIEKIDPDIIEETKKGIGELSEAVDEAVRKAQKLLGREIGSGDDDIIVRISGKKIHKQIERVKNIPLDPAYKDTIIQCFRELRELPVQNALARSLKIIPGLSERLEKDVCFRIEDNQVKIDCEKGRSLNTALVHIFRNAYDHGIESPEIRISSNKPEQGNVTLSVNKDSDNLILTISDDGKGLNCEKLKTIAVHKGIISQSEADNLSTRECYELIFKPGFSSAEEVSDVSGRGVGMDAVMDNIQSLSGSIHIDSKPGEGTTFTIKVPIW